MGLTAPADDFAAQKPDPGKPGPAVATDAVRARSGVSNSRRSVHAGETVLPQALDLFFEQEFFAFEFDNPQVVDRRMNQAIVNFGFECLMSCVQVP